MSYEGYVVGLCGNGHACTSWDAYDDEQLECWHCKALFVRTWSVDQTNCEPGLDPRSNGTLRQVHGGTVERCNLGHNHITEPPRFEIAVNAVATPPEEGKAAPSRKKDLS